MPPRRKNKHSKKKPTPVVETIQISDNKQLVMMAQNFNGKKWNGENSDPDTELVQKFWEMMK